ncbi:hypothetical protein OS175_04545 [Marinicella sp. S1101]|uniref:lipopolysaccharide kinase InaA family protein n=1 Tax=Marinicella marina TaxID=2996016 RepID=UPI002260AA36|nr:lipopolysaccharide kinase InaA family protein [Marinicella marina]MCX7553136.1 hypothetical protein [Marinicella marina]MDJ1138868.1 lipopolysaccharide kinase InaA family protein [Marinicella marina]
MSKLLRHYNITEQQWLEALHCADRVVKIKTQANAYWLKKAAPARGLFRYHALNFFSRLLRLPLLKAVPQPGGAAAVINEAARLKALADAGVPVPKIIAEDREWLLVESMGESIVKTLKSQTTQKPTRQKLFAQCLAAINDVHQKGHYLSQCFVRNMVLDREANQVVFIDFEDDPLTVMSLAQAQARDLLLFVDSTARFFTDDKAFFEQKIQAFMTAHNETMRGALKQTVDRLQWITKLPFQKRLGHDYEKLKLGILALKHIK